MTSSLLVRTESRPLLADKGLSHSSWHDFVHRSKAAAPVIGKFGPQLADPSNTISQ
jgi:hypothetical protein